MNNESMVKILNCTPVPDKICSASARISTTQGTAVEIYENSVNQDKNHLLIEKVMSSGHKSFIEHINFNIAFNNVSAYVEQFMIEFRLASFTIKSRRYVDFRNMGYFIPVFTGEDRQPLNNNEELQKKYAEHIEYLFCEYEKFIESGIPKEDARFLLPYSYRSNFYCTVNAREMCNIIYSMLYGRGKENAEIKNIGESLLEQSKNLCPYIFDNLDKMENEAEIKNAEIESIVKNLNTEKNLKNGVELINHPKNSDYLVAFAALANHGNYSIESINHTLKDISIQQKIIDIAVKDRRKRELEQINFTFRINGISLAAITHIVRHRIQSILIPSYADVCDLNRFIVPDTVEKSELKQNYLDAFRKTHELLQLFIQQGVSKHELVYLCLSGNTLDIVTTMNARELSVFIGLRTCNRSQWEIRDIAIMMLNELRNVSPCVFKHFGPRCFMEGNCPEGKMTCGEMLKVKEKFKV